MVPSDAGRPKRFRFNDELDRLLVALVMQTNTHVAKYGEIEKAFEGDLPKHVVYLRCAFEPSSLRTMLLNRSFVGARRAGYAKNHSLHRGSGLRVELAYRMAQIHWNTGNIGRTCVGLGARLHLVGPLGFSLDEKQVRRAGLDYWTHVDLRVHEDWNAFVSQTGALSAQVFYFTKFGTRTAADMCWPNNGRPLMLVFGSEIDGFDSIRTWIEENVPPECTVAFPMVHPEFRSFNLSTSASMALWDAYKTLASTPAQ